MTTPCGFLSTSNLIIIQLHARNSTVTDLQYIRVHWYDPSAGGFVLKKEIADLIEHIKKANYFGAI